jgi:hypothetical protein
LRCTFFHFHIEDIILLSCCNIYSKGNLHIYYHQKWAHLVGSLCSYQSSNHKFDFWDTAYIIELLDQSIWGDSMECKCIRSKKFQLDINIFSKICWTVIQKDKLYIFAWFC